MHGGISDYIATTTKQRKNPISTNSTSVPTTSIPIHQVDIMYHMPIDRELDRRLLPHRRSLLELDLLAQPNRLFRHLPRQLLGIRHQPNHQPVIRVAHARQPLNAHAVLPRRHPSHELVTRLLRHHHRWNDDLAPGYRAYIVFLPLVFFIASLGPCGVKDLILSVDKYDTPRAGRLSVADLAREGAFPAADYEDVVGHESNLVAGVQVATKALGRGEREVVKGTFDGLAALVGARDPRPKLGGRDDVVMVLIEVAGEDAEQSGLVRVELCVGMARFGIVWRICDVRPHRFAIHLQYFAKM
ncbi:hypothetical protein BC938DRAFT_471775 [Jimgerdemannia flammicorona]|uniref:Uncharacterized protein n=1 Tax=Jimgerdemannia flammicorona TaxID=994334 RepID=A0A433Q7G3_9FUNG|nr:hypothetical protein BC938DRAFT_471775 [Jimgerdemannia flammicorona]